MQVHKNKKLSKIVKKQANPVFNQGWTFYFKNLKLEEQIDFDGEEISSSVSVDRIEKLTDKKYAVEITFAIGPL